LHPQPDAAPEAWGAWMLDIKVDPLALPGDEVRAIPYKHALPSL